MDEDKSGPANFSDINNLLCKVFWNQEHPKGLTPMQDDALEETMLWPAMKQSEKGKKPHFFKQTWKEESLIKLWPIRLQH